MKRHLVIFLSLAISVSLLALLCARLHLAHLMDGLAGGSPGPATITPDTRGSGEAVP
jgi:hypothetical protein